MNTQRSVNIDERTVAVVNASYRWGFSFLLFALLFDISFRGLLRNEAAWDLMALVIVSSGISTIYQARQNTWGYQGWKLAILTCLAAAIGMVIAAIILSVLSRW